MIEDQSQPSKLPKKTPGRQVSCPHCLSQMRFDGLATHKKHHCIVNRLFDMTKIQIDAAISGYCNEDLDTLKSKIQKLEIENSELRIYVSKLEGDNTNLKQSNMELSNIINLSIYRKSSEVPFEGYVKEEELPNWGPAQNNFPLSGSNVECIIERSLIAPSTKKEYLSVWRKYQTWCEEKSLNPLLTTSGNIFISESFNENPSLTVRRNRNVLQTIVRRLIPNLNFTLNKIPAGKIKFIRKKNYLSKDQLAKYLAYIKEHNPDLFLPQYLQSELGLRINAVANFKKENFKFTNPEKRDEYEVEIPDSKVKLRHPMKKELSEEIVETTKEALDKVKDVDQFIFSFPTIETTERSKFLGRKVNRTLKQYRKIDRDFPYLTSHGLRRSYTQNKLTEKIYEQCLKEVSKAVGHSNPNITKNFYVNDTTRVPDLDKIIQMGALKYNEQKWKEQLKHKPEYTFCDLTTSDPEHFGKKCKDSLFKALKAKKIKFSDDLVFYQDQETLENIESLKPADVEVFKEFKKQSREGIYAPVEVVWDNVQGYVVKATGFIPKKAIICEYSGEVLNRDRDQNVIKSDAVMEYLSSDPCELVIYPDKIGNIARFISGIKNLPEERKGKKKQVKKIQNVMSMKRIVDGCVKIILYAARIIHSGEILYYNYNEGGLNEKDTSNFVEKPMIIDLDK